MLIKITSFDALDTRKLMDVYAESNLLNTDYFYPEMQDKAEAVRRVEEGFLAFLRDEFFKADGSAYWVLIEDGEWVAACRTSRIEPGFYYLEALETRPDERRKGYAVRLLNELTAALKADGPFRFCDCVGKKNLASVKTHVKAGFFVASDPGFDFLQKETDPRDYGFAYAYDPSCGKETE